MPDRAALIEELFAAAADLPLEQRRAVLDARCGRDESLRREVEELLACDDEMPPAYLDSPIQAGSAGPIAAPGDLVAGQYTLIRELGHGGMGVVFLAEQSTPVRRRVALKLLKAGLDTRQIIARFHAERQALAMMDHPNIARVLDAGATPEGRPYFAMEYIPGRTLVAHCDEERLTVADRIELFLQVCDAVQHAHTKGVIHRDLKPTNVIVTRRDGRPSPRVIDFGIAKATQQRLADTTFVTERGQLVGTPEYMSPEQAAGDPDIDTRTDVYSLGAVLYELLTGSCPFDPDAMRRGRIADVERMISEVDPAKPSTRVARHDQENAETPTSVEIARRRATTPSSLAQSLKGDLDWVVLRAMAKDRDRRYETVAALGADLRRFLASEPVEARPPSPTYLATRFVRRHRALVTSGAVVGVVLVGALAATGTLAVRESAASREARQSAAQAGREAARAEAVNLFLEQMLTSARATGGRGADVTMHEVLAATGGRLDAGALAGSPDVEAEVRHIIGKSYLDLGRASRAVPHFRWVWGHRAAMLGEGSPTTLDAVWWYGEALKESHQTSAALEQFRAYHDGALEAFGPEDERTWRALDQVGNCLMRLGAAREAMPLHLEAYEGLVAIHGEESIETAMPLFNYGATLRMIGRHADAAPIYRRVIQLFDSAPSGYTVSAVRARAELGDKVYGTIGRHDEGRAVLEEALAISSRELGPEHGETAAVMHALSRHAWRIGEMADAEDWIRRNIEILSSIRGTDAFETWIRRQELASLLISAGKPREALEILEPAIDHWVQADDDNSLAERPEGTPRRVWEQVVAMRCAAVAMLDLGQPGQAEAMANEAIALTRVYRLPAAHDPIECERVACEAAIAQGRGDEVIERLRLLHERSERVGQFLHVRLADTLARALLAAGDEDAARVVLDEVESLADWRFEHGERMLPRIRRWDHADPERGPTRP